MAKKGVSGTGTGTGTGTGKFLTVGIPGDTNAVQEMVQKATPAPASRSLSKKEVEDGGKILNVEENVLPNTASANESKS